MHTQSDLVTTCNTLDQLEGPLGGGMRDVDPFIGRGQRDSSVTATDSGKRTRPIRHRWVACALDHRTHLVLVFEALALVQKGRQKMAVWDGRLVVVDVRHPTNVDLPLMACLKRLAKPSKRCMDCYAKALWAVKRPHRGRLMLPAAPTVDRGPFTHLAILLVNICCVGRVVG